MEKKINIAELLNDCPKGMELDCILFDSPVKYESNNDAGSYPISVRTEDGELFYLSKYGCLYDRYDSKCAIFPKGKTTWDGFVPPCKFKDGDIIFTDTGRYTWVSIFKQFSKDKCCTYIDLCIHNNALYPDTCGLCYIHEITTQRLATEEEKEKLFYAIKAKGYKWNTETKTLEKLPKFKVGDKIVKKNNHEVFLVSDVCDNLLDEKAIVLSFSEQGEWELVSNKFDITTLIPFESRVLVRDDKSYKWSPAVWGFYDEDNKNNYPYEVVGGRSFQYCIPYNDDTKHLIGKTNDCDEYYKTWY